MKKVAIFARVSTSIQDYERQVNELTALAVRNEWTVEATFCEKVSGAKRNSERKELSRMVEYVQAHHINKVAVTELSRLGRDTLQVLEVIEQFNKLGISLYIQNYGIETLTESGEVKEIRRIQLPLMKTIRKILKEQIECGEGEINNTLKIIDNGFQTPWMIRYTDEECKYVQECAVAIQKGTYIINEPKEKEPHFYF